jgi:hypothetical protein
MSKKIYPSDRFKLFIDRVNELEKRKAVQNGMDWGFNLSFNSQTNKMSYTQKGPNEDDLRAFLVDFRHFVANKEPVFINRVFNDAIRYSVDKDIKEELIRGREYWKELFSKSTGAVFKVNEIELTSEVVLDLWINGVYFHSDQEKAKKLSEIESAWPGLTFGKAQLLLVLPEFTRILITTKNILSHALSNKLFNLPENSSLN